MAYQSCALPRLGLSQLPEQGNAQRSRLTSATACLGLTLLAGILTGCGDEAGPESDGESLSVGGVQVLIAERVDGGMDSAGGGRLEVVGGCLGADGFVFIWPPGTEVVAEEPLTIDVPDTGVFAIGEELRIGGGFVLEHSSADVKPGPYDVAGITVPAECAEHDIFLATPS